MECNEEKAVCSARSKFSLFWVILMNTMMIVTLWILYEDRASASVKDVIMTLVFCGGIGIAFVLHYINVKIIVDQGTITYINLF